MLWSEIAFLAVSAQPLGCAPWRSAPAHTEVCNPLGTGPGEDCLLPFPSSFYTRPDPGSPTGLRVELTHARLPRSRFGRLLDPSPYNRRDGYSAVGPLLALFPARIAPASLPPPNRPQESLEPSSPVQMFEFPSGRRIPLFAEVDRNADSAEPQALIVQPLLRLNDRTRYVVAIQGLRDVHGVPIRPLSGFEAIRDGRADRNSAAAREQPRYEELFAFLRDRGLERSRLQLAWDFTTGSSVLTVGRLTRMRDQVLAGLPADGSGIKISYRQDDPAGLPGIWKELKGTFRVPSFLNSDGTRLHLNADGEPELTGQGEFPIVVHVPVCAKTAGARLPVLVYGHGTFNSAEHEMASTYSRGILNKLCMIEVGTDWLGRATSDLPYFLFRILPDWNNFQQITDRLQQAHLNFVALAHLLRRGALDRLPELSPDGRNLADSSSVYYFGISEGACQGVTTLALSPDLERGALNVPCGFWGTFFWRSSDFYYTRWALRITYPGALERQKLLTLSQLLWDYTDPANYGSHLLRDPLPRVSKKFVLYQEGINDASVPNLTTRAMARTIGLPLLVPYVENVFGIEAQPGPLRSAYVQFDVGSRPRLGADNVPPATSPVHEAIRRLDAVQEQLRLFLRPGGMVEDTCGGHPCVFHPPAPG